MEITETRISHIENPNSRLRAYASITFDNVFVVRDIRIIAGKNGLFIAMPSKRMQRSCTKCGFKNPTTNRYCGSCGLNIETSGGSQTPVALQYVDLAHPISTEFRDYLQQRVLEAYQSTPPAAAAQ